MRWYPRPSAPALAGALCTPISRSVRAIQSGDVPAWRHPAHYLSAKPERIEDAEPRVIQRGILRFKAAPPRDDRASAELIVRVTR